MALSRNPLAIAAAMLATTSMTALPASAAELPTISAAPAGAYDADGENAEGYRRYRRHRHGVNAGDVIAGVVVLGAIAAIASSASNDRRDRDRYRVREDDVRYREAPPRRSGSWSSSGIDNAVDMCVDQVERGSDRVESVDNASRDGAGWSVSGSLDNGDYFTCRIDNDGRIRSVDLGDGFAANDHGQSRNSYDASLLREGEQWSDERYARARAATNGQSVQPASYPSSDDRYARGDAPLVDADLDSAPRPAYPGGPLPGEEGYEDSLGI
ncbi:hypothetical protein [Alteraurantiacibacter aquimixticola]|uniref:Secreted protein n=1 Tax=Alteraurantiacibacter aquimixticola TaxID=2489173 RepID=A0A4T3F048_9SPHN|nr:hypothetical protein [Alteraurantiacibacter aquimixticola]TIX50412.1 hypothetical protein E5222_09060 [Alteraurantiacibacter aquimixticola]